MSPSRISHTRPTRRPCGYTLVEMLIVCAVLAALAGLSWPALRGMLAKARLQQAADDLQTTLRKTRTRAISGGEPIALQYEPGGRRYRVGEWDVLLAPFDEESLPAAPETATESVAFDGRDLPQPLTGDPVEKELPVGVRFASDEREAPESTANATVVNGLEPAPLPGLTTQPQWGDPIVFRANGRCDDAVLRLIDERQFRIDVRVRGLSGIVTASTPQRLSPLLNGSERTATDDQEVAP